MKVGDVLYRPCMAGFHWLPFVLEHLDHYGDFTATAQHTCRGIDLIEHRRFSPESEESYTPDLTPELPLPAFAYCFRCSVPLFQHINVGRSIYLTCCDDAVFTCTRCQDRPWNIDSCATLEEWFEREHAPVCSRRCADCHRRINNRLNWWCVGKSLHEQKACAPSRCDTCFLLHKDSCGAPVCRSADHRCPECDHSALEMASAPSGWIRRCTWCKSEWQAYYQNDPNRAWDKRGRLPGELAP